MPPKGEIRLGLTTILPSRHSTKFLQLQLTGREDSEGITPSSNSDLTNTIAARAKKCRDLLMTSYNSLRSYQDGGTQWVRVRDLAGWFNIWATEMDAFTALDDELLGQPDARRLIQEILEIMEDSLRQYCQYAHQVITILEDLTISSDPADNADHKSATESARYEEIDNILVSLSTRIGWLRRLTITTQRARQNVKVCDS
ncbi:hypothetical protein M406DRAFT_71420 [Cryphonectria parasitica EP155]|uniref:Uncharacterized protein n=1 Tax=Cryphonectria parasitica (strain ATCC 38755 / EP155) TaxID=660469 RepID=A0A9P5CRM4_CRYP1|nr:uncharacterized protein M406DRAFT_71420 [Cryphonectria parasitica EP155]KAF3768408.1 hypothetical protein M406DRAFT_71420 [Cryphonectria parasitica EP155]